MASRHSKDVDSIKNAENAMEGLFSVANAISELPLQDQLNVQEALGIDLPTLRLLQKGEGEARKVVAREAERVPVTDFDTAEAARFNDQITTLTGNIKGFADVFSRELLPQMSSLLEGLNDFISPESREEIFTTIGEFSDSVMGAFDAPDDLRSTRSLQRARQRRGEGQPDQPSFGEFVESNFGDFEFFPENRNTTTRAQRRNQQRGLSNEAPTPQKVSVDVKVSTDTNMLKAEVIKVNEGLNQQALDDLTTSTGG